MATCYQCKTILLEENEDSGVLRCDICMQDYCGACIVLNPLELRVVPLKKRATICCATCKSQVRFSLLRLEREIELLKSNISDKEKIIEDKNKIISLLQNLDQALEQISKNNKSTSTLPQINNSDITILGDQDPEFTASQVGRAINLALENVENNTEMQAAGRPKPNRISVVIGNAEAVMDGVQNLSAAKPMTAFHLSNGGFAKCYEIIKTQNNQSYAGKIVSKKLMAKQNQKEKMTKEIQVHASLRHRNVVGFHSFFEDIFNVYIVLELFKKRSMTKLHKRRRAITEPETRFYMTQLLGGIQYLHHHRIIHRDLKLGNLFLNNDLHVKIGYFGLAAKIVYDGERKKTSCGTPNYIAPEILNKKDHSYKVDIWSIGCIMYTLLVGKPPFETNSLKETYARIKKCDYTIGKNLSPHAKHMIMVMLQAEPAKRPTIDQLCKHEFITTGYCPPTLPVSCLTMAPRFDNADLTYISRRKPLQSLLENNQNGISPLKYDSIAAGLAGVAQSNQFDFDAKENLLTLRNLLIQVIRSKPVLHKKVSDEMTDPAAQPTIWVSKWVDYSEKYGFGYQLSDESVGVMFNDTTRLIMLANSNVQFVDNNGEESYMTVDNYPKQYDQKMKVLSYFSRYMRENLFKTEAGMLRESDSMSRTPHLYQWCYTTSYVLMQLNNGSLQINFKDHTKIIMCPLMAAVTYIDEDKSFRTFRFSTIEKHGCPGGLYEKMRYTYDNITLLLESKYAK